MGLRITQLNDGGASRDDDWLVVARDGRNYKIKAGAGGLGALHSVNNLSDVADAATSLANLGGVPLSGDRALQLYGATIVDPLGNGDFVDLASAVAATPAFGIIYVASDLIISSTVVIDKSISIGLMPGVNITGSGVGVVPFEVQGALVVVSFFGTSIDNTIAGVLADTIRATATADGRILLRNITILSVGVTALEISNAGLAVVCEGANITGTTAISLPAELDVTTSFTNCNFSGNVTNLGAAWTDAPFYHCTFDGTITGITFSELNLSNADVASGSIGNRGLSIYTGAGVGATGQTIVVDPSGNAGDYTTIAAAVAAASASDVIRVFGQFAEPSTVSISQSTIIYFEPGSFIVSSISGAPLFDVTGASTLYLWGDGFVLNILGQVVRAAANTTVHVRNLIIGSSTANTIEVTAASADVIMRDVEFYNTTEVGLDVPGSLNAASIFQNCIFRGATYAAESAVAWANAPFYHCTFIGGRNNITFAAGNNSNVDV